MIRFDSPSVPDPLTVNGARIGAGFALLTPPTNGMAIEGSVGIGIIAPTRVPLHVHNPLSAAAYIHLTNGVTGSAATDGLSILMGSDGVTAQINNRETGAGANIGFQLGGVNRVRINNATEVGVGVTIGNIMAGLHVQKSLTQLRLDYAGAGNHWDWTVGSNGALTMQGNGAGGSITISPTAGQNIVLNPTAGGYVQIPVIAGVSSLYLDTTAHFAATVIGSARVSIASGVSIGSAYSLNFTNGSSGNGTKDLYLWRDAANTLAQRNGVNPQAFNLYNTYTDASNYERGFWKWDTNALKIGVEAAGTGVVREVHLSGIPTSNPGPGILWNNAGTLAIGT